MIKQLKHKFWGYILHKLAVYLEKPSEIEYHPISVPNPDLLRKTLQPCDILLIEGNLKYSEIIKYVTQSTWSHCALYIGDNHQFFNNTNDSPCLIEALLSEGVVLSPLSQYFNLNTRILRPVSLNDAEKQKIIDFCLRRLGNSYDIDNILDLLKYYVPLMRIFIRKKGDAGNIFGSGNPEKVICSSLLAQAFETVNYPILPIIESPPDSTPQGYYPNTQIVEILRKRHFSLYSPRDFDTSPFFQIIKPTLENGFNHNHIHWRECDDDKSYS